MALDVVLEKLNRLEAYTQRLAAAPDTAAERDRLKEVNAEMVKALEMALAAFDRANVRLAGFTGQQEFYHTPNIIRAVLAKTKELAP